MRRLTLTAILMLMLRPALRAILILKDILTLIPLLRFIVRLHSHGETKIADTRVLSSMDTWKCNWETQIARYTYTAKTQVTESLSSVVTRNVSVYFIMSSDSSRDE